jgi:hypothetical protein
MYCSNPRAACVCRNRATTGCQSGAIGQVSGVQPDKLTSELIFGVLTGKIDELMIN